MTDILIEAIESVALQIYRSKFSALPQTAIELSDQRQIRRASNLQYEGYMMVRTMHNSMYNIVIRRKCTEHI